MVSLPASRRIRCCFAPVCGLEFFRSLGVLHRLHRSHQKRRDATFEGMKRTSVTITDDLEKALEAYRRDQDIPPRLVDIMQAALAEYLEARGYLALSSAESRAKPKGVSRDRAVRIEGPDNLGAAVIEDRR